MKITDVFAFELKGNTAGDIYQFAAMFPVSSPSALPSVLRCNQRSNRLPFLGCRLVEGEVLVEWTPLEPEQLSLELTAAVSLTFLCLRIIQFTTIVFDAAKGLRSGGKGQSVGHCRAVTSVRVYHICTACKGMDYERNLLWKYL